MCYMYMDLIDQINFYWRKKFYIGTVNGIDKSVWGGLRRRKSKEEVKENVDRKDETENNEKKEEQSENSGILTRIKKAIFGWYNI